MPQCVETCGDKPESARRDILKLLTKTNLNSFDRSCSNMFPKKRHVERMQTYPAHRSWQQHFFGSGSSKAKRARLEWLREVQLVPLSTLVHPPDVM